MSNETIIDGYYLFASSIAALVARTITHPLDTIKTRIQTSSKGTNLLKQVIFPTNAHKLTSLYRGLPVTLLFSVPALSVYLTCYESTKQVLDRHYHIDRHSVYSHLISGCFAEVAAGTLFTPMEVLKNRLQTQRGESNNRVLISHIFKQEGIRGFYRGYVMGLVVFVPHSMAYFVTYEKLKQYFLHDKSNKFHMYMLCSSLAGVTSIMVSTPLDIIKTRWQISAAEYGKQYRLGPMSIATQMMREGKGAFTRGLWARIAWGIPTTTISMTVFELLKDNKNTLFPPS
ncbi:mitochondrial carrier domain-containing protein [Helicostylum pulchrum]|uniref:Mitochondrial carrier protein n=1 Tax=Helicostylum pulchrum TaxID=562976 RepID=A0ABP9YEJ0_9FUNG|nr:mitochondrial carrier domain-containing protein [Helicostylum pulchrum]